MKKGLCFILCLLIFACPALAAREDAEAFSAAFDAALGRAYRLTELYYDGSDGGEYAAAGVSGLEEVAATFAYRAGDGETVCCVMLETGAADHGKLAEALLEDPAAYEEEMAVLTAFAAAFVPENAQAVLAEALRASVTGSSYYAFFGGDVVTGGVDGEELIRIVAGDWEFGIYATMDIMVFSARRAE